LKLWRDNYSFVKLINHNNMPTFIDMSALTKRTTLTGNEEFQVSATEKVTAQQIADLADTGVKVVIVTNFKTNVWTELGQNTNIFDSIPIGEMVVFKSADDAASGPGEVLIGYAIKYSNLMVTYVGMTTNNGVSVIPTLYIHKSAGLYDTKWQKLPDTDNGGVQTVEITDFAIPSVNITKDGQSFLFYANDASNIPNTNNGATSFVGVAIASPIYITGAQKLLYYMMIDTARGMFYTGRANTEDDTVAWNTTPITRLGQAVHVTAFTESALSSLLYTYKAGDFIPFYTSSVTASEANQFPESGVFNGFISMGSNEGDYFQIFAFKTGAGGKAYSGSCIGSTTTWTELGGGGGEQTVIWINANQNVFDVGLYPFTKLGEMFPIFIDTSATNNPSKEGYPCAGTVQCIGYQGPESWEAVFVVGSADEDQTPRGDYYKAHLSYDMGGSAWIELTTGSSGGGMEALWTPTEATYVMVNSDAGNGAPVQINLTRALKATDRVLITWRKQNTSYSGIDVPGQAIINPNAYANDVFLELVENFVTPSEYYGLFLDQSTTEAGSEALLFSAASWGGSTYGPQYLITGIYNISGK
jgi:hypothetical protein